MDKSQEKLIAQAANARLVHMNEQLVFPILSRNVNQYIDKLCHDLKVQGTIEIADVAYIAACKDLMLELASIARDGDRAFTKLTEEP